MATYQREYKARDPEKHRKNNRESRRQWRIENPDKAAADHKRYRQSEAGKDHQRRKDAIRRGARSGGPYKRIDVFKRDEGICHLCSENVVWEDFSLDHLIPISKGGPDCFENVATAHLECNVKRGNRPLTELFQ